MAQPQQKREAEASQKCAQLFKTRLTMLYDVLKEMPLPKRGGFNYWRAAESSPYFFMRHSSHFARFVFPCPHPVLKYIPVLNTLKCQGGRKRWKINAFCLLICPSKCCMWRAFEFSQFKNFSTVYLMFSDNIACDLAHH